MSTPVRRRDEIAAGLDDVRRRIADAAAAAGRSGDDVTLVVVTKFFPASDIRLLAELGVTDVGENRHPEAGDKLAECGVFGDLGLRWHFIGGLQSNKAAAVGSYADVVESVDRVKLVNALNRGAHERSHEIDVLLQVSLDPPGREGRAGADARDLPALADAVDAAGMLRLRGLMAIAPLGEEPRAAFDRLAEVQASFLAERPDATWLSAGMSNDFEAAIGAGATHVRVGSAILGARPEIK
jgi:pyridoxal phosphate enzyme (YggS family)